MQFLKQTGVVGQTELRSHILTNTHTHTHAHTHTHTHTHTLTHSCHRVHTQNFY